MKKRNQALIFLTVLMISALCACSAMNTAGDKNDMKKESRATGSAVTGSGANAADDWEPLDGSHNMTMSGDTYYDMRSPANDYLDLFQESDKPGLVQYTKDGKKRGEIIFPKLKKFQEYVYMYADDRGMVYSIYDEMEAYTFYYLPFAKDGDGNDVIDPEKSQKLFSEEFCEFEMSVYVDAHYIIFFNMKGKYIRYEMDTEKLVEEYPFGKGAEVEQDDTAAQGREIYCYVYDEETGDNLCCQDLATMEWKILRENVGDTFADVYFPSQGYVLFVEDDSETEEHTYYCRDVEKDRFYCVISPEKVFGKLKEEGLARKGERGLCSDGWWWYLWQGRVYVQYLAGTYQDGVYDTGYRIFSAALDGSGLRYERELTERMRDSGVYKHAVWHKSDISSSRELWDGKRDITVRANASQLAGLCDGVMLFLYENKKGDIKCGVCDMSGGGFREVTKEDKGEKWYADLVEQKKSYKALGFPMTDLCDEPKDLGNIIYEG